MTLLEIERAKRDSVEKKLRELIAKMFDGFESNELIEEIIKIVRKKIGGRN